MLGQIRIFTPRKGLDLDHAVEYGTDPNLDSNIVLKSKLDILSLKVYRTLLVFSYFLGF